MNRFTTLLLSIILSVAAICVPGVTWAQPDENPDPPPYSGLFVPTADALTRITGATYLLPYPPILATQVGFSIQQIATINVMGGFLFAPWEDSYGFLSTASLKLHPLLPTPRRWGLAAQVQWMGGGAVSGQGDGFGIASNIVALELIVSSPVRSIRTHFGAALHTLPWSGYSFIPQRYDINNLQTTVFISAETRTDKRVALFSEFIWAAIGADDGYDSAALLPIGTQIRIGGAYLKIASGMLFLKFGSSYSDIYPMPPVIGVTYLF